MSCLPELAARDGDYILQVVEPLEEMVYFDEAKLIAVDHPAGTTHPSQRDGGCLGRPAPLRALLLQSGCEARAGRPTPGRDVTDSLPGERPGLRQPPERDGRFAGFARDHFIELDFADRLESLPAGARWVLFLDGWVEYSTSTSNFAASQAGLRLKAPEPVGAPPGPLGRALS